MKISFCGFDILNSSFNMELCSLPFYNIQPMYSQTSIYFIASTAIVTGCFHGSYGQNCSSICKCPNTCDCDPETGECPTDNNVTMLNTTQRCKSAKFKVKLHFTYFSLKCKRRILFTSCDAFLINMPVFIAMFRQDKLSHVKVRN